MRASRGIRFIIIAIVCLGVVGYGLIDFVSGLLPATNIYYEDCDWEQLKSGQHVKFDLDFVLDPFEETTDSKTNRSISQIYTVPDLREHSDGLVYMDHYMGIKVNASEYYRYNMIVEASYNWWEDTTGKVPFAQSGSIAVDGRLKKMTGEEQKFIKEYLKDYGYTEEEIDSYVTPYVIIARKSVGADLAMIGIGGLLAIVMGILAVVSFKGGN